ncbi:hypothetical protein B0A49_11969 [Cryomyces minteri]|uniref:Nitroreductase domain-containing protein n=1 Tax=Cryomyces minteri TaxID=331657 RepID=A0A4V5NA50_9PEZI|nr:hypothetical protein B0A49_11969 [Cryomyces minteri]
MAASKTFMDAVKTRRTYYQINKEASSKLPSPFPQWSEHTSAMHQYVLWTALEAEGFGANLQHYNPIIDQKAQTHWKIPMTWSLKAQLVFGGRAGEPGEKQFQPIEERVFVHGK